MVECLTSRARSFRLAAEYEPSIAIPAFDEILLTHFEIDLRVPQNTTAAIAGNTRAIDRNDFRRIDRHQQSARLLLAFRRLRLLFFGQVFAGRLIHHLHGQPHLAAVIHTDQFHFHNVALFHHISDLGDALRRKF